MKGLILKDLYSMRVYGKSMILAALFLTVFGVMMNNPAYICCMCIFLSFSMSISGVSMDEKVSWDRYAAVMPVSQGKIVLEKILLSALFVLLGGSLGLILGGAIQIKAGGDFKLLMLGCVAGMGVAMFLLSMVLPILIKFGSEAARYAMMGVVAVPVILVFILTRSIGNIDGWLEANLETLVYAGSWGCLLLGILALAVSYPICLAIYRKKEW